MWAGNEGLHATALLIRIVKMCAFWVQAKGEKCEGTGRKMTAEAVNQSRKATSIRAKKGAKSKFLIGRPGLVEKDMFFIDKR